jgi:dTDP-glucose pyrophosphorylase
MNILVMLAGSNEDFLKNGQKYPKLLTEIGGKTMIEIVIEGIRSLIKPENNIIFILNKNDHDKYYLGDVIKIILPESSVTTIENETAGAALTSLLAIEYINEEDPMVLINGDQLLDINEEKVVKSFIRRDSDAGVIVFDSLHPRWSYVKINKDGLVLEAAEKKPISNKATAGFYYYKRAADYIRCAKKMILKGGGVNGLYYVCPVFNEMILEQKKILTHQIDQHEYHSFMSPQKVKEFEQKGL